MMAKRASQDLEFDGVVFSNEKAVSDESEDVTVGMQYIKSATVDGSGHVEYSYACGERPHQSKSLATVTGHDDVFDDIYTLTFCERRKKQHFKWNSFEKVSVVDITYRYLIDLVHVDPVHLRMACLWFRQTYCVDVWNLSTNEVIASFEVSGDSGDGSGPEINILGDRLLVVLDKSIIYWDVTTRSAILIDAVNSSADGKSHRCSCQTADYSKLIISCGRSFEVFSTAGEGMVMASCVDTTDGESISCIVANPESTLFFLFYDYGASVYDALVFTNLGTIVCGYYYPHPIGFGPGYQTILVGGDSGYTVWNYCMGTTEDIVVDVGGASISFQSATFNANNNMIVGFDEEMKITYAVDIESQSLCRAASAGKALATDFYGIYCSVPAPAMVLF
jgi:hypothetical protein